MANTCRRSKFALPLSSAALNGTRKSEVSVSKLFKDLLQVYARLMVKPRDTRFCALTCIPL